MIDRYAHRRLPRGAWLAAAVFALALAGCAQYDGGGYGSSTPSAGYASPNPYHYRCTGNCQAGL